MKRSFYQILSILGCIAVFSHCSADNDFLSSNKTTEANFPKHIENYGKTLAKELRQTIYNLNEMGIDYSDAKDTPEFKERFFSDWSKASPTLTKSGISDNNFQQDPKLLAEKLSNLTKIQREFLDRIIKESQTSSSLDVFKGRLSNINKEIYKQVPEIEQERLFLVTATLFYSVSLFEDLKLQGQMLITPYSSMKFVKTRSESGGGAWGMCKQYFSAVVIALGTISTSEVVTACVYASAQALFIVTVCFTMTGDTNIAVREKCLDRYVDCSAKGPRGDGKEIWKCDGIYKYCLAQNGVWDISRY